MQEDAFTSAWRTFTPEGVIAIRLILACVCGGAIGLEREVGRHDAGLRTHILTSLAACVFTLVAWELYEDVRVMGGRVSADPIRVVEAVTAGAGFLSAGIIFHTGGRAHGLTTGAGVWTAAAIGIACGAGAYAIAALTTLLVLIVLFGLTLVERRLGLKKDADNRADPKGGGRT